MLTAVIVTNLVISLACFFAAWRLWKIRRLISKVADALAAYEQSCDRGLSKTPNAILKAQRGTYALRQRYRKLDPQFQRVQQFLSLLGLSQAIWRNRTVLQKRRNPMALLQK